MKRVICLYRVSTVGQVDHDDIPMQRIACHEYVATHPDWTIVDEISEKGVSGYRTSANDRDAIIEIKKRACVHDFDVLLVFMFDRLGRREDETPFLVQWFVKQGIEVWSTREGEQRFDNHVDKLLNYIRYWQASGESEKTSIRIKTKHSQMVQEGQYRGGLVPYGYKLMELGRTNKKNKPVPDLVIDETESKVVREIYHLIKDEGYGTRCVANWLNTHGIKTKKDRGIWRGSAIRFLIENPIYIGVLRFGQERSRPFEHLRIIDDETFYDCIRIVKGRSVRLGSERIVTVRKDNVGLLTGMIYCKHCGGRLTFGRNLTTKTMVDGSKKTYTHDLYRCYGKLNARNTCDGPTTYTARKVNNAVLREVTQFFERVLAQPKEEMLRQTSERKTSVYKDIYDRAIKDREEVKKQVAALEDQLMRSLTGEQRSLDIDLVNSLIAKYRDKLSAAEEAAREARERMEKEKSNDAETLYQYTEFVSWAESFTVASLPVKRLIISKLIERIDVGSGYDIHIKFKLTAEEFAHPAA